MKSVTITNQDGTTTHYNTLKSFCDSISMNQSTLCNIFKIHETRGGRMTKKSMCLENKTITIHNDNGDDQTIEFGKYEPLDYNRSHTCECGVTHYYRDMKRHKQSKHHQNWEAQQNIQKEHICTCPCGKTFQ